MSLWNHFGRVTPYYPVFKYVFPPSCAFLPFFLLCVHGHQHTLGFHLLYVGDHDNKERGKAERHKMEGRHI